MFKSMTVPSTWNPAIFLKYLFKSKTFLKMILVFQFIQ